MIRFEVCANSAASAIAAQNGGAHRIELCDNLHVGGTTPSLAQIKSTLKYLHIPVYVIIRPREGDFLYSDLEFEIMKEDIALCGKEGCKGVVFGVLKADGSVDTGRCAELAKIAQHYSLGLSFHRAFDVCKDQFVALEEIIKLGFERVLTSGAQATAIEGAGRIKDLITKAGKRITIMPGGGITENNISELLLETGAREFHASARTIRASGMERYIKSGDELFSSCTELTSADKVRSILSRAIGQ